MKNNEVAVMMPVFNAAHFLDAAILSLLAQNYTDFLVYAYDDHSDDSSFERLQFWAKQDSRVKVARPFSSPGNYTNIINQIIDDAHAHTYIARMDADDVSLPNRLSSQLEFMNSHPHAVLAGVQGANIIESEHSRIEYDYPWESQYVNPVASYDQPINEAIRSHHRVIHGTFFSRTRALIQTGGYKNECFPIEDWELSLNLSQYGDIFILPVLGYLRRIHSTNSSKNHPNKQAAFDYINKKYSLGLGTIPLARPKKS
jgi:glycosyltransferase involved in cell wall biosynthesis